MTNNNAKRVRLILGCILSVLLVVSGILLMISCVKIYRLGSRAFNVENISSAFQKIRIPLFITLGVLAVDVLMALILPTEAVKARPVTEQRSVLKRLEEKNRKYMSRFDEMMMAPIQKEIAFRKLLRVGGIVLSVAASLPALIRICFFQTFDMNYNARIIESVCWILPSTLIVMGIGMAVIRLEDASCKRQIEALKAGLEKAKTMELPAAEGASAEASDSARSLSDRAAKILWIVLLAVAVVFIVAGSLNGGMADVLSKAVNICTECIGLG